MKTPVLDANGEPFINAIIVPGGLRALLCFFKHHRWVKYDVEYHHDSSETWYYRCSRCGTHGVQCL